MILSWNSLPPLEARGARSGAVSWAGKRDHRSERLITADDGSELAIGRTVAAVEWPQDQCRRAERERLEVSETVLPEQPAVEGELVHHADDAAIVGRTDPHFAHGVALRGQEGVVDAVAVEDRLDRTWRAVEQRGRWCELHEHREQRSAIHQQRDLRPPEQRVREPVAQRRGRLVAVAGRRGLHPIAQLLGASDHQHEGSLAPALGDRRRGPGPLPRRTARCSTASVLRSG